MRSTITGPRPATSRVHRWGGATAVAALALGGFLVGGQGVASAEPAVAEPSTSASVTWKISEYVTGWLPGGNPGVQGTSTESGHVTRAGDNTGWTFTDGVRSVSATGVTTIAFDATVDIRPYSRFGLPAVQILIVNPILSVDAAGTGTLKATVSSVGQTTSTPAVVATLADFAGATVTPDSANPALSAFAATPSYAGTGVAPRADSFPLSFVNAIDSSLQPFFYATGANPTNDAKKVPAAISGQWTAPGISIAGADTPLPWAGATLSVTGKGYNPAAPGVYVAVGPVDVRTTNPTDWTTNTALYSAFAWVRGGPGGNIAADGSFTTTLDVKPVPGRSSYAVYTFRAHGNPDRSQDAGTAPFEFLFPFPDYPASGEFAAPIAWMANEGISTGFAVPGQAKNAFKPNDNAARDAAAAFFYRLAGSPAAACTAAPFPDVTVNHQFCKEISWAKSEGLINGFVGGKYKPATSIDRGAFAAITYRFANDGARAPKCTVKPFSDVQIKDDFCGEITWLASRGITTGFDDGTFRQTDQIDRQALAAFLYRLAHPAT